MRVSPLVLLENPESASVFPEGDDTKSVSTHYLFSLWLLAPVVIYLEMYFKKKQQGSKIH